MTENKITPDFKKIKADSNRHSENIDEGMDNFCKKRNTQEEKQLQNLKILRTKLEINKIENLESEENKNDLRGNQRHNLNTEFQELDIKKNKNDTQPNIDKPNNILGLVEIKNKTELIQINALEHYSKMLKKKIDIQKKTKWFKIKNFFVKILDNNIFIIFMMGLTIFILFVNDIQNGWLRETVDKPIEIIQTLIFCLYFFEIIITSICKEGYINSFFFWLDILSTIYIIQDISFIMNPILGLDTNYL